MSPHAGEGRSVTRSFLHSASVGAKCGGGSILLRIGLRDQSRGAVGTAVCDSARADPGRRQVRVRHEVPLRGHGLWCVVPLNSLFAPGAVRIACALSPPGNVEVACGVVLASVCPCLRTQIILGRGLDRVIGWWARSMLRGLDHVWAKLGPWIVSLILVMLHGAPHARASLTSGDALPPPSSRRVRSRVCKPLALGPLARWSAVS